MVDGGVVVGPGNVFGFDFLRDFYDLYVFVGKFVCIALCIQ